MWTEMLDAADPANIPANWTGPVQGYPNRIPPWTPADFTRFAKNGYMKTSVQREAAWGHLCREIDVETGAALVEDVPNFIFYREHLGLKDGGVYLSLDRWPALSPILVRAKITPARIRIRIAAWDGDPTAKPVLSDGYEPWAKQYENAGPFDRTAIYGSVDMNHKP